MKTLITLLGICLLPFVSIGQKKQLPIYGQVTGILNKAEFFGGGAILGAKVKRFGIGAGLDFYKVDKLAKETATPLFLDVRYFFNTKTFHPFIAGNVGAFNWKHDKTWLPSGDYSVDSAKNAIDQNRKGKMFFGGELGFYFSKSGKQWGPMVSIAVKNVEMTKQVYRAGKLVDGDDNKTFFQIKLGFKF